MWIKMDNGKTITEKVRWYSLFLIFGIAFLSYYYLDIKTLTVWGTNIWDTIFTTGNLRDYYAYSAQNKFGLYHQFVGSDILIYLIWAIWNIPIWLVQFLGGITIADNPILLLYSKCFLLVMIGGIVIVLSKIVQLCFDKKSVSEGVYIFLSSCFLLYSVAYAGQNDIISIFIYMVALLYLIKGNARKFVIFAAIAIACKPFLFVSFIAVVLVKEKEIGRILLRILEGVSLLVLQKLLFIGAPMYKESMAYGPMQNLLYSIFYTRIDVKPFGISVFVMTIIFVYIGAYLVVLKPESSETELGEVTKENISYLMYYSMLPLLVYMALADDNYYRPLYYVAFFAVLFVFRPGYKRANLWLDFLYCLSRTVRAMICEVFFFNPQYRLGIIPSDGILSISERIIGTFKVDYGIIVVICNTVAFCSLLLMAIINHPKFKSENEVINKQPERYLFALRIMVSILPLFLSLFYSFI